MKIGVSLPIRELKDDIGALVAFAQAADELGYSHLRVPDQVLRPNSGHLHEPLIALAYIAAATKDIELCPSVIVAPARQTVLLAKQLATLDAMSGGRVRLGIGVGGSAPEYQALGEDFHTRGRRCEEQIDLLRRLWTEETVDFEGRWDTVHGAGLDPLPVQRPIPIWIGAGGVPVPRILRRMGRQADGWFVLCSPEQFDDVKASIDAAAVAAGRDPGEIGTEAGVAVVGAREAEWKDRVRGWQAKGVGRVCLRTLGGGLDADGHIAKLKQAWQEQP
ncbi:MAG: TIGR03619 family F420-dependent LLM class oxidoreductase [Gammaproteobacteria bacterium]|nr:TIGR03619 family F420-dependent LLM class oxidoreductase [Gammaproteobacteria bacterium]MYB36944.1 TIGR03619 family F420-dependent LLM class oxidoreductase [Gammaproteobacteria bacterium]